MERIKLWQAAAALFFAAACSSPGRRPASTLNEGAPVAVRRSPLCSPLPPSAGIIIRVTPDRTPELPGIVASAPSGAVILLSDGVYPVSKGLIFSRPNVTMRSLSSQERISHDPQRVVIDGANPVAGGARLLSDSRVPELVGILASGITIADVTLQNARDHLVHVQTAGGDTRDTRVYNVDLIDPGEQAIKINTVTESGFYADEGEVSCSWLELTDAGRGRVAHQFSDGCYTGGIDAQQSRGWRFVNNVIRGFWCPRGLAEHAIHVWTGSRDTVIEGNEITNSARGIGLGLGQYDDGAWREYSDAKCGARLHMGHYGGRIRNNAILANDPRLGVSRAGFATGIGLEAACDVEIANNTIISTVGFRSSAIEWRFAATNGVVVTNNLSNGRLIARDRATGIVRSNVTDATASWFRSVGSDSDLHLARTIPSVVHQGAVILDLATDKDGRRRGSPPDIGAYEYGPRTGR